MGDIYAEFDEMIDEDAWEYLNDHAPTVAATVKRLVERGATPEALRQRWLKRAGEHRIELAHRIENAAAYLVAQKQRA